MIACVTFKALHDTSTKATPPHGNCNVNARQLGNAAGKKPDSATAHMFLLCHSDDQEVIGWDEIVTRVPPKRGINFVYCRWPAPVPAYDVLPIRPQGLLRKYRRRVRRHQDREAERRSHMHSLTRVGCLVGRKGQRAGWRLRREHAIGFVANQLPPPDWLHAVRALPPTTVVTTYLG